MQKVRVELHANALMTEGSCCMVFQLAPSFVVLTMVEKDVL